MSEAKPETAAFDHDLWQEGSNDWQNQFMHHHILILGYTAWIGYINEGRGMVVCEVVDDIPSSINWQVDTVSFHRKYIPQVQSEQYLQALELPHNSVTVLLDEMATYDPTQAIVVLIIGNSTVDINLLQHLKVSPSDCYSQVQRRWAEFQPDFNISRKHS